MSPESRRPDGRSQRSASLVWGLLFLIIAAVAVLTSNHLVGHAAVRLGVPLALIVTGLLGLVAGSMRTHGGIGGAGPSGAPTPTTTRHNATGQGEP